VVEEKKDKEKARTSDIGVRETICIEPLPGTKGRRDLAKGMKPEKTDSEK